MFSSTERSGIRRRSSNTMPSERRSRVRLPPFMRSEKKSPTWTMPSVGRSSMERRRRRVVLPEPEAPSTTTLSPAGISKLTAASAGLDPNRLVTPANRITLSPLLVFDVRSGAQRGHPAVVLLLELDLPHQIGKLLLHLIQRVGALLMAVEHLEDVVALRTEEGRRHLADGQRVEHAAELRRERRQGQETEIAAGARWSLVLGITPHEVAEVGALGGLLVDGSRQLLGALLVRLLRDHADQDVARVNLLARRVDFLEPDDVVAERRAHEPRRLAGLHAKRRRLEGGVEIAAVEEAEVAARGARARILGHLLRQARERLAFPHAIERGLSALLRRDHRRRLGFERNLDDRDPHFLRTLGEFARIGAEIRLRLARAHLELQVELTAQELVGQELAANLGAIALLEIVLRDAFLGQLGLIAGVAAQTLLGIGDGIRHLPRELRIGDRHLLALGLLHDELLVNQTVEDLLARALRLHGVGANTALHEEEVELLIDLTVEDGLAADHGGDTIHAPLRGGARGLGHRGRRGGLGGRGLGRLLLACGLALGQSGGQRQDGEEREPLLHEFSLGETGHGIAASARSSTTGGCSRRKRARNSSRVCCLFCMKSCCCAWASWPGSPLWLPIWLRSRSSSSGVGCEEGTMTVS